MQEQVVAQLEVVARMGCVISDIFVFREKKSKFVEKRLDIMNICAKLYNNECDVLFVILY